MRGKGYACSFCQSNSTLTRSSVFTCEQLACARVTAPNTLTRPVTPNPHPCLLSMAVLRPSTHTISPGFPGPADGREWPAQFVSPSLRPPAPAPSPSPSPLVSVFHLNYFCASSSRGPVETIVAIETTQRNVKKLQDN